MAERPRPVIFFALEAGAAIAEEARFLGDGVAGRAMDRADAGFDQPALDIAADVEHEMARTPRRDEENPRWPHRRPGTGRGIPARPRMSVARCRDRSRRAYDRAPRRGATIAVTVAPTTPLSAPFQPAWAAPITLAAGSARRTGTQSAVRMPRAMPRRSVTSASARGLSSRGHGSVTVMTSGLWIW